MAMSLAAVALSRTGRELVIQRLGERVGSRKARRIIEAAMAIANEPDEPDDDVVDVGPTMSDRKLPRWDSGPST